MKTSWKHSTWTPCLPASSISGRWAAIILSLISSGDIEVSPFSDIWIKPPFSFVISRLPRQFIVGKVNTAPDLMPSGQREVTVFRRV